MDGNSMIQEDEEDEIDMEMEDTYIFTKSEISTLYSFLKDQYIHYENTDMLILVKKIRGIIYNEGQ